MKLNEIRNNLRKLLLEKKNGSYKYGCVMAQLKINKKEWDSIQELIKDDELYTGGKNMGREDDPHITLLYGLHDTIEDKEIKEVVEGFESFDVELKKVDIFENDEFDVVKFSITNKDLNKYNKELKEFPYTSDFPDYKAHATIAYVKKGLGKEIMGRYKDFEAISFTCDTIKYSKADKTKKYFKI